jgi:hypothetical protein
MDRFSSKGKHLRIFEVDVRRRTLVCRAVTWNPGNQTLQYP